MKKIIVAVDGYSSCGKSTMAKSLAEKIGYTYIDSGAMYRAVTLFALQKKCINKSIIEESCLKELNDIKISFRLNNQTNIYETYLNGQNVEPLIRTMEVSEKVSLIASLSSVRKYLVEQQQLMGKFKGIVMDGRDIGTVVFPNAELKIFVTAKPEVRAQRRFKELQEKGESIMYEEVLKNLIERDHIDTNRTDSPLVKAKDSIELDNTYLTASEQLDWLLNKFYQAIRKA